MGENEILIPPARQSTVLKRAEGAEGNILYFVHLLKHGSCRIYLGAIGGSIVSVLSAKCYVKEGYVRLPVHRGQCNSAPSKESLSKTFLDQPGSPSSLNVWSCRSCSSQGLCCCSEGQWGRLRLPLLRLLVCVAIAMHPDHWPLCERRSIGHHLQHLLHMRTAPL
jgi:hypothetical protein